MFYRGNIVRLYYWDDKHLRNELQDSGRDLCEKL